MIRVCFVCLGNICRSPTAEGIMRSLVAEAGLSGQVAVDSAGTGAWHVGEPPDERSAETAGARGVRLAGRARQFEASDFRRFEYVVAIDRENRRALQVLAPSDEASDRISLLRAHGLGGEEGLEEGGEEGRGEDREADVPDPYYGGPRGFEDVFDICEAGCRGLLALIRERHAI